MSDLPMTLLDLDAAGLDPTQPAPVEFVQFLYDNSRSGYLTLWSAAMAQPDGAARINRWINDALAVYHARTLQTQMAPEGDKPVGAHVTEVTYSGATTPAVPVCIDVPFVSGTPAVDSTLTCTMGNWGNMDIEPVSYAYAWSSGGTESSYLVTAADAGATITCVVSATNAGGTTAAPPSNAVMVPAAVGMAQAAEATERTVPRREYPKETETDKKEETKPTTGSADHRRK